MTDDGTDICGEMTQRDVLLCHIRIILFKNIYRILFPGREGGHARDRDSSQYLEIQIAGMGGFHDRND